METRIYKAFAVSTLLLLCACSNSYQMAGINNNLGSGNNSNSPMLICSVLDFSNVTWPSTVTGADRSALELALNISGSFEGNTGWANLTNNFDGQGVSMGLLNQNLGQGSLQPMLINMENNYLSVMQSVISSAHLTSLLAMLSQWQDAQPQIVLPKLNVLDMPSLEAAATTAMGTAETASVQWAVTNLYDGGTNFDSVWYSELNNLANTPQYISIQIQTALAMHTVSISEIATLGVHELRTYLMFFDIEVQDGSVYAQDFTDYATWVSQNPQSTDTQKLVELLTLRLRHVIAADVADVQSRKMAIINGSGVVHEDNRNLQAQYCYNGLTSFH